MGYDLEKRLSSLWRQADSNSTGRIKFGQALLGAAAFFAVLSTFVGTDSLPSTAILKDPELASEQSEFELWKGDLEHVVEARRNYLNNAYLGLGPGDLYFSYASTVANSLAIPSEEHKVKDPTELIDLWSYVRSFCHSLANALLRVGFIVIGFWPIWIVASIVGWFTVRLLFKPHRTTDILGVCDRGNGPFYSGIFGPFSPNKSFSGTDFSCPSLACPRMVKSSEAVTHNLTKLLRTANALNETNLDLVRIILAYRDFPSTVEDERAAEEDTFGDPEVAPQLSQVGIIGNEDGIIEKSALEGLRGVCEAHRALVRYFKNKQDTARNAAGVELGGNYLAERAELEALSKKLSPLGQLLLLTLTPTRARALASLPTNLVASAYLAIEAGKSMVYRKVDKGFLRISRLPHLQARATLQSLVTFHKEYDGDQRLIVRQAIMCSRRHGDFGRAFLPTNMPVASRALRDWLETLYVTPARRMEVAHLTELDGHLDEIHINWRQRFSPKVREEEQRLIQERVGRPDLLQGYPLWKGLVHKSVVLVPLNFLVDIALAGIDPGREERISELFEITRRLQASLSISARLPGFKRQAAEAEKSVAESGGMTKELASSERGAELIKRWLIVRRMLTRFNWLSTRIGDNAVPQDGLVKGIVINREEEKAGVFGLDALVPLRQRRFKELFGANWERLYYYNSPHQGDLEVHIDSREFEAALKLKMRQAEQGLLGRSGQNNSEALA